MLDLGLGNWWIWYEKVWAAVYLVPSNTKVLEIYLLKNTKMLHDEFPPEQYMLFRLGKLPLKCYLQLHWVLSSFVDPYERFVMLLKSRSRTHHPHMHYSYTGGRHTKTCLPYRSAQKCSTPTVGVNTKTYLLGFPSIK
jgi:hypothetical protein